MTRLCHYVFAIVILAASVQPSALARAQAKGDDGAVAVSGPADVAEYFDSIGFNIADNPAVAEAIPRTRVTHVPQGWDWDVHVPLKKSVFFRASVSGALQVNEQLLADRVRLLGLDLDALSNDEAAWLRSLAEDYDVQSADNGLPDAAGYAELVKRVDAIPPSLTIAQAAVESGWAGSRFAQEGNALFGQWTSSGGIKAEGSDARLAAFPTPRDSVIAYARNLNTHPAYEPLRAARAAMRESGEPLDGHALAAHLGSYAEIGREYVDLLQGMIKRDDLGRADTAKLADGPVILLRPEEPQ